MHIGIWCRSVVGLQLSLQLLGSLARSLESCCRLAEDLRIILLIVGQVGAQNLLDLGRSPERTGRVFEVQLDLKRPTDRDWIRADRLRK